MVTESPSWESAEIMYNPLFLPSINQHKHKLKGKTFLIKGPEQTFLEFP